MSLLVNVDCEDCPLKDMHECAYDFDTNECRMSRLWDATNIPPLEEDEEELEEDEEELEEFEEEYECSDCVYCDFDLVEYPCNNCCRSMREDLFEKS